MLQKLRLPASVLLLLLPALLPAGTTPVGYRALLRLDRQCRTLTGTMTTTYRNLTSDTLDAVWFHLFPNAFARPGTDYGRELEQQGRFAFSLAPASARGGISITEARSGGSDLEFQVYETEMELLLAAPIRPGDSVQIELDFIVELPEAFGEIGRRGRSCLLAHCLPKVARRSGSGWHVDGYHVCGHSPAEFADYDVSITAPAGLELAATGIRTEDTRLRAELIDSGWTTHRFLARNLPDFALFAGHGFVAFADSAGGKEIELLSPNQSSVEWLRTLDCISDIIHCYSEWYGPYPFEKLTVVQAGRSATVDASYPGLVIMAQRPVPLTRIFEQALARQIALQWFGTGVDILRHPWLALGPATHAEMRYLSTRYGKTNLVDHPLIAAAFPGLGATYLHRVGYYVAASNGILWRDPLTSLDPLGFTAWNASRPGLLLLALAQELTTGKFDSLMRHYLSSTRGRHHEPADFERLFPGFSTRLATLNPDDTLTPSRLNLNRVEVRPIVALPSFNTYQLFYGPYLWFDGYHGFQLQGWLMGRLFVDCGPLRGRHMWMLSQTYSTKLKDWHTSFSYSTPLEFITNRLRLTAGLDRSGVEAGAKTSLVWEIGPVLRPPQLTAELGYRFLSLHDLRLRDRRAWDSAAFSDVRTRLTHTYEQRNFKGSQRFYLARGLRSLGGDYSYWKLGIEQTHTFRWRMNSGITLRLFAGTIHGGVPAQEQFYLSGGLSPTPDEPVSWAHKDRLSGQEHWHYDGDVNCRGYAGEYRHGRHAWGLNLYLVPVGLIQPFFDIGNTLDTLGFGLFCNPKMDAGVRLRLGPLYADFPFWRYDFDEPGHRFAFRWMLGLKISGLTSGM